MTERQPKVVVMLLHLEPAVGNVEEPGHTERAVDSEARKLVGGAIDLQVVQVVGEARDDADVSEKVVHTLTPRLRHHVRIAFGGRCDHILVNVDVEIEHRRVEELQWIRIRASRLSR